MQQRQNNESRWHAIKGLIEEVNKKKKMSMVYGIWMKSHCVCVFPSGR